MLSSRVLLAVAALGVVSASSLAQVAPPPPPAEEPEPEFVPPPMPAPRPQTPARPARQAVELTQDLPDLPYPALYEFCGTEDPEIDGVCRFEDNLHYVALRPNPTISPGMVERIQPVIVARRSRLEESVIEHLDAVFEIEGGMLQELSISNPQTLQELLERIQPLTAPTSLTQELKNRGILSRIQSDFNNKIIREYQQAYGDYLKRVDPDNATNRYMQLIFEDSLIEAMQAYRGILHESRLNIDKVVAQLDGLSEDTRSALLALKIDTLDGTPEMWRESAEAVAMAWRPLSMEQKKEFLRAVQSLRQYKEVPPVAEINVMWSGKNVRQGKKPTVGVANVETEEGDEGEEQPGTPEDDGN